MKRNQRNRSDPKPINRSNDQALTGNPAKSIAFAMTRRKFLILAGVTTVGVSTGLPKPLLGQDPGSSPDAPLTWIPVLRPNDLLSFEFEFHNLLLQTENVREPILVRAIKSLDAYIIVHFQPQHIAEEVFFEAEEPEMDCQAGTGDETGCLGVPIMHRISGSSRLAFLVPKGVDSIPYTLESLMAWVNYPQSVAPIALSTNEDMSLSPAKPTKLTHTAIEAPWRLYLSPHEGAAWAHSAKAVNHLSNRFELWHTRLGVREEKPNGEDTKIYVVNETNAQDRTLRAIWTPGYTPEPDLEVLSATTAKGFVTTLDNNEREQIVALTSDYSLFEHVDGMPLPIQANRFTLSTLGAWLDSIGTWAEHPSGYDLVKWVHRATMGRDHYVRVVKKGYLFPFGHRAALIKVSERKFNYARQGPSTDRMGGFIRQRFFIILRQPIKKYGKESGQKYEGREFPFKEIQIKTLETPNLDKFLGEGADDATKVNIVIPDDAADAKEEDKNRAFWPRVGQKDFLFHMVGTDWADQQIEFTTPVIFVRGSIAVDAAKMEALIDYYNKEIGVNNDRRKRPTDGQKIAIAEPETPDDTTLEVRNITFGASPPGSGSLGADQPLFFPKMSQALVRLAEVEQIRGGSLAEGALVAFNQKFLEVGLGEKGNTYKKNRSGIFADVFSSNSNPDERKTVSLEFSESNRSGGVITPNMGLSGLSRKLGPLSGKLDSFFIENPTPDENFFNPKEFFAEGLPKILGGLDLSKIIKGLLDLDIEKIPQMTTRKIFENDNPALPPIAAETTMQWKPGLKRDDEDGDEEKGFFVPGKKASLQLDIVARTDFEKPDKSSFKIIGELKDFTINLIGDKKPLFFIGIEFNKLTFTSEKDKKTDIDVDVRNVTFGGILEIVNVLQQFLSSAGTGFSGIDISPTGINASYAVPLPDLTFGLFSIQNMSLGAGLNIPFTGEPVRLRFFFSERQDPCTLTVSIFGGGAYIALALGLDGVESLEAAFEFGGNFSLNIGVASGGVYVMAGVYFEMAMDDELGKLAATITAYFRMGGSVDVLGLISISVEFYLGLTYKSADNVLIGQAKLKVKVKIVFFSISVTLEVERKISTATHSVSFRDLIPEHEHWTVYAEAFAPIPARPVSD